jgi:hypothetical protein
MMSNARPPPHLRAFELLCDLPARVYILILADAFRRVLHSSYLLLLSFDRPPVPPAPSGTTHRATRVIQGLVPVAHCLTPGPPRWLDSDPAGFSRTLEEHPVESYSGVVSLLPAIDPMWVFLRA